MSSFEQNAPEAYTDTVALEEKVSCGDASLLQALREGLKTAPARKKEIPEEEWRTQCDAIDDSQLHRYLKARDFNVKAATALALKAEEWSWKWKPTTITPDDISISLPSGCGRFAGFSKDNRPILLCKTHF